MFFERMVQKFQFLEIYTIILLNNININTKQRIHLCRVTNCNVCHIFMENSKIPRDLFVISWKYLKRKYDNTYLKAE